jgi:hypothetical protein
MAEDEREESNIMMNVICTSNAMDFLFDKWVILVRCTHHCAE